MPVPPSGCAIAQHTPAVQPIQGVGLLLLFLSLGWTLSPLSTIPSAMTSLSTSLWLWLLCCCHSLIISCLHHLIPHCLHVLEPSVLWIDKEALLQLKSIHFHNGLSSSSCRVQWMYRPTLWVLVGRAPNLGVILPFTSQALTAGRSCIETLDALTHLHQLALHIHELSGRFVSLLRSRQLHLTLVPRSAKSCFSSLVRVLRWDSHGWSTVNHGVRCFLFLVVLTCNLFMIACSRCWSAVVLILLVQLIHDS